MIRGLGGRRCNRPWRAVGAVGKNRNVQKTLEPEFRHVESRDGPAANERSGHSHHPRTARNPPRISGFRRRRSLGCRSLRHRDRPAIRPPVHRLLLDLRRRRGQTFRRTGGTTGRRNRLPFLCGRQVRISGFRGIDSVGQAAPRYSASGAMSCHGRHRVRNENALRRSTARRGSVACGETDGRLARAARPKRSTRARVVRARTPRGVRKKRCIVAFLAVERWLHARLAVPRSWAAGR